MPITTLSSLSEGQAASHHAQGFRTVEELAEMTDEVAQQIGGRLLAGPKSGP